MAIRWLMKGLFLSLLCVILNQLIVPIGFSATDDVPRITVQELKAKMDNGDDLAIVDV